MHAPNLQFGKLHVDSYVFWQEQSILLIRNASVCLLLHLFWCGGIFDMLDGALLQNQECND